MENAGVAGEAIIPRAFWAVADDGVVRPAMPFFEVLGPGDADLLVPSTSLAARQVFGLGVVEHVIQAVVLEDTGLIEAALLPRLCVWVVGAQAGGSSSQWIRSSLQQRPMTAGPAS